MKTIEEMKVIIKDSVAFKNKLKAWEDLELLTDDEIKRVYLTVAMIKFEKNGAGL